MSNWTIATFSETTFFVAQGDGGPQPGGGGNGGTTGADGGAAPARPTGGAGWEFMLPVLLVFGLVMIWAMFRQKREQKKRDELLSAVKKRDRVQTIGGIIGSVVEVKSNTVVLKVDESSNTRMTFARSAIQQILSDAPDKEQPEESPAEKAE